jgi:hypothetical protein
MPHNKRNLFKDTKEVKSTCNKNLFFTKLHLQGELLQQNERIHCISLFSHLKLRKGFSWDRITEFCLFGTSCCGSIKSRGGGGIASYSTTSALDGGEWSASRPGGAFTPGERTPSTHCTGGWVDPRACLDTEDRRKILYPCRGSNPDRPVVQPVVRHYTDWAIPTLCGSITKVFFLRHYSPYLI